MMWVYRIGNATLSLGILSQNTTHVEICSSNQPSKWLRSSGNKASRGARCLCYKYKIYLLSAISFRLAVSCPSSPLTSPQSHRLPVFLQLRDQPVSLLDHVRILLVLVVWPVRFYNLVDAVDGAGYAVCRDELRQVSGLIGLAPRHAKGRKRGMGILGKDKAAYRSRKSTETPKSCAILPRPTTL